MWANLTVRAGACAAILLLAGHAHAAGGAYVVDDAAIDDVGTCKVESWISLASNTDLAAVSTPACVVPLFLPTELGLQAARTRTDGEWGTSLTPKFKTTLVKPEVGKFGLAISVGATFDVLTGENTGTFVNVPVTFEFSKALRVNVTRPTAQDSNGSRSRMAR